MTTYVLGAGASHHAGYPLCSELWPKMAAGLINQPEATEPEFRVAIDEILALNGPVTDIEAVLTDLDLGQGAFHGLEEDHRRKITGTIRRCIRAYLIHIHSEQDAAALYAAFAKVVTKQRYHHHIELRHSPGK